MNKKVSTSLVTDDQTVAFIIFVLCILFSILLQTTPLEDILVSVQ